MKTTKKLWLFTLVCVMALTTSSCSGDDDDDGMTGWYSNTLFTTKDLKGALDGVNTNSPYIKYFSSDGELCIGDYVPQTGSVHYAQMVYKVTWLRFVQFIDDHTMAIYSSGKVFKKGSGYGTKVYELEGDSRTGPLEVYALDGFYCSYKRDGKSLRLSNGEGETFTISMSGNSFVLDGLTYTKISSGKH